MHLLLASEMKHDMIAKSVYNIVLDKIIMIFAQTFIVLNTANNYVSYGSTMLHAD